MTENQEAGHDDKEIKPPEEKNVDEVAGANSEIIELSDIAIGITPEDDAIVELTEEVIGEALDGFAGAVREIMKEGEEILDLSEDNIEKGESDQALETEISEPDETIELTEPETETEADTLEEDISKELDNYFETENEAETEKIEDTISPEPIYLEAKDEITADKVKISESDVEAALERVIHKMYSEKINRLLDEAIETKVSNEIDRFKEYLISVLKK